MKFRTRLQRLEKTCPVARGCPACRDRRGRHFLVDILRNPDATLTYRPELPAACPACGTIPEFLIQVMLTATDEAVVCRVDSV